MNKTTTWPRYVCARVWRIRLLDIYLTFTKTYGKSTNVIIQFILGLLIEVMSLQKIRMKSYFEVKFEVSKK